MLIKSPIETKLDKELMYLLEKLERLQGSTEEYDATVERLTKLYELKSKEKLKLPSLDTVLIVSANVFGILWLTRFEKENVIRSKSALSFIMKPR